MKHLLEAVVFSLGALIGWALVRAKSIKIRNFCSECPNRDDCESVKYCEVRTERSL